LRCVARGAQNLPLSIGPLLRVVATSLAKEWEDFMLKRLSTLIAAGAFVALLAPGAQAFTPAPLATSPDVLLVAGGCGPGFHRGPYGGCRPNIGPVCRRVWVPGRGWRRVCR
jgi:hypothetical protein